MMLDDFKQIIETKAPHTLQDRLVTLDEAKAVITNYNRLTDPYRSKFMNMPINNIIEFSLMAKAPSGGFKNYMKEVEDKTEKTAAVNEELDYIDKPITPIPIEPVVQKPRKKLRVVEKIETAAKPQVEQILTQLVERIEKLSDTKQSIIVETTEGHVERLIEIEKLLLESLNQMNDRVVTQEADTHIRLTDMLEAQRLMVEQVNEMHNQITKTQTQIVATISLLTEKVGDLMQNPPAINPIVNVPAPIVNVTMQEGRRTTKTVERDDNGLISKITEGYELEPA